MKLVGILCIASLALFGCADSTFRFERLDGDASVSLPFRLQAVDGARRGGTASARIRAISGGDNAEMILQIDLGPPPICASGTYRVNEGGRLLEGPVTCESFTFLGGQADTPSVGGTFAFKDSAGRTVYRLHLPPTPMERRPAIP